MTQLIHRTTELSEPALLCMAASGGREERARDPRSGTKSWARVPSSHATVLLAHHEPDCQGLGRNMLMGPPGPSPDKPFHLCHTLCNAASFYTLRKIWPKIAPGEPKHSQRTLKNVPVSIV